MVLSEVSIPALTNSNFLVLLSIVFVNEYKGTSVFVPLNLYCSVTIPSTVAFLTGRPKREFAGNAAFNILINCSYQSLLVGSFHSTVCPFKLLLLASNISSVVLTLSILSKPFAAVFLLAL